MANGDTLLSTSGKTLLKGGKVILSNGTADECCCSPVCCPDGVPTTYTITLSDVALDTSCIYGYVSGAADAMHAQGQTGGTIDGTYDLTQRAEPYLPTGTAGVCAQWSVTVLISCNFWAYYNDSGSCVDTPDVVTTSATVLLSRYSSGHFDLFVYAINSLYPYYLATDPHHYVPFTLSGRADYFKKAPVSITNCLDDFVFTNEYTSYGAGGGESFVTLTVDLEHNPGKNGTASISTP